MPPKRPVFTECERQLARILLKKPDISQSDLARAVGISRQSVSARLQRMFRKYIQMKADKHR